MTAKDQRDRGVTYFGTGRPLVRVHGKKPKVGEYTYEDGVFTFGGRDANRVLKIGLAVEARAHRTVRT